MIGPVGLSRPDPYPLLGPRVAFGSFFENGQNFVCSRIMVVNERLLFYRPSKI